MARINVEDTLYQDRRFFELMMRLKDMDKALGCLVRAWVLAQKWYLKPEKGIPIGEWETQQIPNEIIEVGLADRVDGYVFIRGADAQFAWLTQRVEAGRNGGIARGRRGMAPEESAKRQAARLVLAKAIKAGEVLKPNFCSECLGSTVAIEGHHSDYLKPLEVTWLCKPCHAKAHREVEAATAKRNEATAKTRLAGKAEPKQTKASYSPSISSKDPSGGAESPAAKFIGEYVSAYQARYGDNARPFLGGKTVGQIQTFLKDTPITRACELIKAYCGQSDPWFVTKAHDFATFAENVGKVGLALDTGNKKPVVITAGTSVVSAAEAEQTRRNLAAMENQPPVTPAEAERIRKMQKETKQRLGIL